MASLGLGLRVPFTFSQSSLTDFDRCRRLFRLRWLERLEWPGTAASRWEEERLGRRRRFHRLLHQHVLGIDVRPVIEAEPDDSELRAWWESFCAYPPPGCTGDLYPELELLTPVAGHWVTARLDLLAVQGGGSAVIVDWKTGRQPPAREDYEQSWQTLVYLYLLGEAGGPYCGGATPLPDRLSMLYWFAEFPASPLVLRYGHEAHTSAHSRLHETIAYIGSLPLIEFTACDEEERVRCLSCLYAGYCGRESSADPATYLEDDGEEEMWDWSDEPDFEG